MMQFHTIVHPTDFSASSAHAFRYACALARDCDAQLVVVHALEPAVPMVGEGGLVPVEVDEMKKSAQEHLDALDPHDASVHLERVLRDGPAPSVILDVAAEFGADLVVMGTHGRTGLRRMLMGSVAEMVMRRSPCPVLTVKEPTEEKHGERKEEMAEVV
jgi:nucleotide-binding universal stress UspA family protein